VSSEIRSTVISHAQEIGTRALVLNEANVCCDIPADTTWAGSPAKDVTAKFGTQFEPLDDEEKTFRLEDEIARFEAEHPQFIGQLDGKFDAVTRTYHKTHSEAEVKFLRWTKAKFAPIGED
jgi:hypothetical protein